MKLCEGALIFLLGLSAFAASVVAPTKSELEAMYAVAANELNAGHLREALQQLDAIDARQPDMAAAKNLRGVALMRMGEYGVAEKALQKARELDPGLWEARFNLAEIPFLRKSWAEARDRFEALADGKSEQAQGATGDLIQFKILLTYLLEGKEEKAAAILDRLQTSTASPAYYCGKAAIAFRHRDETEARVALKAAEKSFSPRLHQLFVESFYEVGWMEKPDGAGPVALEVTSLADQVAGAQEDFVKAEQAYRQQDYEGALQLLDQVDAKAPNQAVSYNLRGEILLAQGKAKEAEAALGNALAADPQFADARYNLARIPFQQRDYEAARKQLEAILGATSGGRQQRQREQLIRYQIFLTLLLEGRDGPAQKAMEEFKMMDDSPALYYAQAAWAFQHGNEKQGNIWVANAGNLFPENLNQTFAAPFADLGWLGKTGAPVQVASTPEKPLVPPEPASASATPSAAKPAVVAQTAEPKTTPLPKPSATPVKIARDGKSKDSADPVKKKRTSGTARRGSSARAKRSAARGETAQPAASPPPPVATQPPRQNFGDKVARFFLYPLQHRNEKTASPAPAAAKTSKSAAPTPAPAKN